MKGVYSMPNGRTELDEKGCEYGRTLALKYEYIHDALEEVKQDTKDIKTQLEGIRRDMVSYKTVIWLVSGAIAAAVAKGISAISGLFMFIFNRK